MSEQPTSSDGGKKLAASVSRKRRSLPRGLTGNALVSGVVSAIVAGAISLAVAHYHLTWLMIRGW
jgi:hypothetical protein